VYLNRQYFLNTVLFAVLCIPFLFIKQIYIKIGQDPEISALAAQYAKTVLPGAYFQIQSVANLNFASAQS
jgi:hypothetical protein